MDPRKSGRIDLNRLQGELARASSSIDNRLSSESIPTDRSTLPETFKNFDAVINQQKDSVRWINKLVKILNVLAIALTLILGALTSVGNLLVSTICQTLIIPLAASVVIYAVCRIRKIIKAIDYRLPN